jgi:hypothetical protein
MRTFEAKPMHDDSRRALGCRRDENGGRATPVALSPLRALGLARHGLLGGADRACPILVTLRLARGGPPQLR